MPATGDTSVMDMPYIDVSMYLVYVRGLYHMCSQSYVYFYTMYHKLLYIIYIAMTDECIVLYVVVYFYFYTDLQHTRY